MSELAIAQIIIGLIFFYFLPGWIFVKIAFNELEGLEKTGIAVIISIMIGLIIGVFFGYDINQASLTGGFTETNIWLAEIVVTLLLATILLVKNKYSKKVKREPKKDDEVLIENTEPETPITKIEEKESKTKMKEKSVKTEKPKKEIKEKKPNVLFEKWNALRQNKGLYQFILRSIIFFGILIGAYLIIFLWFRHTNFFIQNLSIDDNFYVSWLTGLRKTDFLNAAAFAVIAFLVWNKDAWKKLPSVRRSTLKTAIFGSFAILSLVAHYYLKYWIGANQYISISFTDVFTVLKLFLLLLFALFTALSVYTKTFISWFVKKYWKSIVIFAVLGIIYFFLIQFFQLIWYQLSYFVAISIKSLLSLTFDPVIFSAGTTAVGPKLGVEGFIVGISNECSGIDSLLLFISLYTLLLVLDWKKMNVKRMAILFIPGLIGTVAYNILRIYLLLLVGVFIDPVFAVDVFHTNIGWILFLVFFVIFWHFGSKWVYKKSFLKSKKKDKEEKKEKSIKKKEESSVAK